jgi:mono/diheme cytochrome c family protein
VYSEWSSYVFSRPWGLHGGLDDYPYSGLVEALRVAGMVGFAVTSLAVAYWVLGSDSRLSLGRAIHLLLVLGLASYGVCCAACHGGRLVGPHLQLICSSSQDIGVTVQP